ncbi:hypothetical protein N9M41_02880 [Rhodopirellula sp.]|nr:hypothetical protein [Rhodopirellula sp.]MDA9778567.1 hypothetical protein [Rubripirellula sp.]
MHWTLDHWALNHWALNHWALGCGRERGAETAAEALELNIWIDWSSKYDVGSLGIAIGKRNWDASIETFPSTVPAMRFLHALSRCDSRLSLAYFS